ncbi:MAG TPA: hypothetical protein VL588_03760, partial [Bdellovibrionota bacterium]|nr:hypothetical protein [Bdellovibrionota bacterium]
MKILLLNPHIDAEHEYVRGLQGRGVGVLVPSDSAEAFQMLQLHGSSVDLAIVHREGEGGMGEDGLEFVKQFKADAAQADLPFVLTTEKWTEAECAQHQTGPTGANAYLIAPFSLDKLYDMVEAVTGQKLAAAAPGAAKPAAKAAPPAKAPPKPAAKPKAAPFHSGDEQSIPGLVLEDASALFSAGEVYEASDTSIRLEMPVLAGDDSAATPVVAAEPEAQAAPEESPAALEPQPMEASPSGEVSIPTAGGAEIEVSAPAFTEEEEVQEVPKMPSIQELKAQFEQVKSMPIQANALSPALDVPEAVEELPPFEPAPAPQPR